MQAWVNTYSGTVELPLASRRVMNTLMAKSIPPGERCAMDIAEPGEFRDILATAYVDDAGAEWWEANVGGDREAFKAERHQLLAALRGMGGKYLRATKSRPIEGKSGYRYLKPTLPR